MSHPLDETQATPWGKSVDEDRRIARHEINVLRATVKDVQGDIIKLELELKVNTNKTDSIKRDTQWLVDASRGGVAWGKLFMWVAIVLGAIAAFGIWVGWPHK